MKKAVKIAGVVVGVLAAASLAGLMITGAKIGWGPFAFFHTWDNDVAAIEKAYPAEEHQNEILFIGSGIAQQSFDDLAVGHMPFAGLLFGFSLQHSIGRKEQDRKHTDDGADDQKGKILTH